jgi:hypothetical protein
MKEIVVVTTIVDVSEQGIASFIIGVYPFQQYISLIIEVRFGGEGYQNMRRKVTTTISFMKGCC